FYAGLSDGAGARITLPRPERIAVDLPTAGAPSRGPRSAPVTIVEFGDFECPPCGRMYPQTEAVLKNYAGRVRLVYRHFPLPMHPRAFRAATASVAAGVQGKFWPYAGRLFENQKALGDPSLRAYAAESGLSAGRFDRDLDSEAAAVRVVHDMRLGKAYGARWTPTLFVNGVMLRDSSLAEAVETALAGASRAKPAR
ncbi:MAG TPA: thioredoxin domain-containing protein, partial [Thermoanaerobaculia bacterium]|nr:thioredoxin domain-containing protein [Thermoanaerobaculia bacterium]